MLVHHTMPDACVHEAYRCENKIPCPHETHHKENSASGVLECSSVLDTMSERLYVASNRTIHVISHVPRVATVAADYIGPSIQQKLLADIQDASNLKRQSISNTCMHSGIQSCQPIKVEGAQFHPKTHLQHKTIENDAVLGTTKVQGIEQIHRPTR